MPHYPSDSAFIKDLFRMQRSEQEDRSRKTLGLRTDALKAQVTNTPDDPKVYIELAHCHAAMGEHLTGVEILERAACRLPLDFEIHYALLRMLQKCGLDNDALAAGERACRLLQDDFILRLEYELYLPKLYDSEQEILAYHRRYQEGLERCIAACDLETREGALRAARGFSRYSNFYLAYQGFDNLAVIRRYGQFVHRVMSAAYPQWSRLSGEPPIRKDSKPRIGYISAYFREHTVGKLFLGWLTQRDRNLYTAHCYYSGDSNDAVTDAYRRASDSFFQSRDLEAICAAIQHDRPDVLVFTDVGMDPVISQIAALRLAPVQCVTWGHPVTTGLPTVDYFISSELMEPPDSRRHYTEDLIRLTNLGIFYTKPLIPRPLLSKTRADFGLPQDRVVYLSSQSQFKYLPQHDRLFAEIAVAVPNSHFVFLAPNQLRGSKFLRRLQKAFSAVGLSASESCTVLPEQNNFDYWNLHLVSDIFLDTAAWSGGRTSLEAVACGLPIVTLQGDIMRARHTAGILTLSGSRETIALEAKEYVSTAARLGREPSWRKKQSSTAHHQTLFSDDSAVRSLEKFLLATNRSHNWG